jgi:hypothetical protein
VFSPILATTGTQTTNFPIDLQITNANTTTDNKFFSDRLRGFNSPDYTANQPWVASNLNNAEATTASLSRAWNNTGFLVPPYYNSISAIYWNFQRAPGFFDEVCYTGTGSAQNVTHNLGVVPELIIVKNRSSVESWPVYSNTTGVNSYLIVNTTASTATVTGIWGTTTPTTTTFGVLASGGSFNNQSGSTYVAYLFATCPGVSKVGSYTGTGATQTIDCGFTGGARFVLIKRTDSTGDWYVWDTARGMVSGTDPSLLLNSTAAEVNANSVYTTGVGFQIVSTAAGINASGGTYIFLAVA